MTTTTTPSAIARFADCRKRVRRGESFGRIGVDRTISNSLKSPNRQRQRCTDDDDDSDDEDDSVLLQVSFAEDNPVIHVCSHFEDGMTDQQVAQRKKELWYTRNDFEEFLRERISTIRLLKAVQGNSLALREHCPDLCLRGLEPYQCDTLNQEMQCQRQMHLRVVLTEQSMQKSQRRHEPERIRSLAQGRSEWARKRALQLASLDALEVKSGRVSVDDSALLAGHRRSMVASAQLGLENLMLNASISQPQQQQQQQQRRTTLSNAERTSLGLSTPRRLPVDLAILKEWNAKFLQEVRTKAQQRQQQQQGAKPTGLQSLAIASSMSAPAGPSLSDKTAESRRALQRDNLLFRSALSRGGSLPSMRGATVGNNTLGFGELLNKGGGTRSAPPDFRFVVRRDSLLGLHRDSIPVRRAAASAATAAASGVSTVTTAAAATAAAASAGALTEACFRFPVRRDSLSNVHWS